MTFLDGMFWIALGVLAAIGWILVTASSEAGGPGRERASTSTPVSD